MASDSADVVVICILLSCLTTTTIKVLALAYYGESVSKQVSETAGPAGYCTIFTA